MTRLDEAIFCDWIDGTLNAAGRATVEAAFAADPALRRRLEAMRADQTVIAALEPQPAPASLRRSIEAIVPAAMADTDWDAGVVDTLPIGTFPADAPRMSDSADWRARHRAPHVAWGRWSAVAAVVGGVLGLGVWWGLGGPGGPASPPNDQIASGSGVDADDGPERVAVAENAGLDAVIAAALSPKPIIDERNPGKLDLILVRGADAGDADAAPAVPITDDDRIFPALLVAATDLAALERHLQSAAEPALATVTRNLTIESVAAAERAERRNAAPGGASEPLVAGEGLDADPAARGRWNRKDRAQVRDHLRELIATGPEVETGVVIAGPEDGATPYADQVVLSLSGAQWTIAVRAADAPGVLAALHEAAGGGTRLGMIDLVMQDLRSDDTSWADARGLLRAIAEHDPERIIHLPVAAVARPD
ncbi:MAG: hypothetical protein AB8G96_05660 [Phycisphaerales bacterium]